MGADGLVGQDARAGGLAHARRRAIGDGEGCRSWGEVASAADSKRPFGRSASGIPIRPVSRFYGFRIAVTSGRPLPWLASKPIFWPTFSPVSSDAGLALKLIVMAGHPSEAMG